MKTSVYIGTYSYKKAPKSGAVFVNEFGNKMFILYSDDYEAKNYTNSELYLLIKVLDFAYKLGEMEIFLSNDYLVDTINTDKFRNKEGLWKEFEDKLVYTNPKQFVFKKMSFRSIWRNVLEEHLKKL